MKIYTSYYGKLKKLHQNNIKPIGISLYPPKYFEGHSYQIIAPRRNMLGLEYDEYKAKYFELLDNLDMFAVLKDIERIANGSDVALLCYETLNGDWCHRTMFAEYVKDKWVNIVIEEFDSKPKNVVTINQISLF